MDTRLSDAATEQDIPKVSIAFPVYNGERYLEHTVQSLLDQTFADWEIIFVDDGSSDSTPEMIDELARRDPRITALHHEKNSKLPAAMNTGFAQARGEYRTWAQDDNPYHPEALERMVSYLDEHPEVDLVYTDYSVIDENGTVTRRRHMGPPEGLLMKNCLSLCYLARAEVYEAVGEFPEDCFLAEDYDLWLRAYAHFNLAPLNVDLYQYRLHGGSLTGTNRQFDVQRAAERCQDRYYEDLKKKAGSVAMARSCLKAACKARRRGDHAVAEKWIRRAHQCTRLAYCYAPRQAAFLLAGFEPDRWIGQLFNKKAA